MSNFYKIAEIVFNNRTQNRYIDWGFPLVIKKNENEFNVTFDIYIDLELSFCIFTIKSTKLDNNEGTNLPLFIKVNFDELDKFNINKDDNYNIEILSKHLEFSYKLIDDLTFDLARACFITNKTNELKKLVKEAFCYENKKYNDGVNQCSVCFEKVNTKTKCFHCILKVDDCPICRRNINFPSKQLIDSKYYMETMKVFKT